MVVTDLFAQCKFLLLTMCRSLVMDRSHSRRSDPDSIAYSKAWNNKSLIYEYIINLHIQYQFSGTAMHTKTLHPRSPYVQAFCILYVNYVITFNCKPNLQNVKSLWWPRQTSTICAVNCSGGPRPINFSPFLPFMDTPMLPHLSPSLSLSLALSAPTLFQFTCPHIQTLSYTCTSHPCNTHPPLVILHLFHCHIHAFSSLNFVSF